jgi:hypothetical protein
VDVVETKRITKWLNRTEVLWTFFSTGVPQCLKGTPLNFILHLSVNIAFFCQLNPAAHFESFIVKSRALTT